MIDYYKLLEVDRRASTEVIEKAHKALSLKYHPDLHPGQRKSWATERMKVINEAYSVLSIPEKRSAYDEELRLEKWRVFYRDGILGLVTLYLGDQKLERPTPNAD